MRSILLWIGLLTCLSQSAVADDPANTKVDALLADSLELPGIMRFDLGVSRAGTKLPALVTRTDLDPAAAKLRVVIIGSGVDPEPSQSSLPLLRWFYESDEAANLRERFALSAVPLTHPDSWAAGKPNGTAAKFPPEGNSYSSETHGEEQYLWRWLGIHAPDLVITLGTDETLAKALQTHKPCGVGTIPAVAISASGERLIALVRAELDGLMDISPARAELQRRLDRSPLEIGRELSKHYGHNLNSATYIPAVALIGRLRLGELTNDPTHLGEVQRIVAPYADATKGSLPEKPSGSHLSGHLIFSELARATGDGRYTKLAQRAADHGFDAAGQPRDSMPSHNEMSDAVFMGCPILVQTGRLTGEANYYDMALRHFRFMAGHCVREDELYRHSPLDETAWGRGNGFPALGLALCLSDLPADQRAHAEMLTAFRRHLAALARHQDASGMWHQVIDHSGSYREMSCTCMITFAMLRGIERGWLDRETYAPCVERAWSAIKLRIGTDGTLVDVCTGTGKQRSLQNYLDRTAILGRDDRGGAMALLVATEMAASAKE